MDISGHQRTPADTSAGFWTPGTNLLVLESTLVVCIFILCIVKNITVLRLRTLVPPVLGVSDVEFRISCACARAVPIPIARSGLPPPSRSALISSGCPSALQRGPNQTNNNNETHATIIKHLDYVCMRSTSS